MRIRFSLMAAAMTLAAIAPASAMPRPPIAPVEASAPVETVAHRHRRGFYHAHGVYYYNGHRGFVFARPGYRYHRGYWFPAAAFAAGAAAGAAVVTAPAPSRRLAAAHVAWCYETYRSYRSYDNTYQPYEGPRRQCWSPYS